MQHCQAMLWTTSSQGGIHQQLTIVADCIHHIAYVPVGVEQLQELLGRLILAHLHAANMSLWQSGPKLLAPWSLSTCMQLKQRLEWAEFSKARGQVLACAQAVEADHSPADAGSSASAVTGSDRCNTSPELRWPVACHRTGC